MKCSFARDLEYVPNSCWTLLRVIKEKSSSPNATLLSLIKIWPEDTTEISKSTESDPLEINKSRAEKIISSLYVLLIPIINWK